MTTRPEPSIQERLYPWLTCFGCGHANPRGLKLRSFADGDQVVGEFMPWPEHDNGGGFLNGGIISTVLDCHSGAAMMLEAERLGMAPGFHFVTAGLDVAFLRPTPLSAPSRLFARVISSDESEMRIEAELIADDRTRATARAHWRRFRPR